MAKTDRVQPALLVNYWGLNDRESPILMATPAPNSPPTPEPTLFEKIKEVCDCCSGNRRSTPSACVIS